VDQLENYILRYGEKTVEAVLALPEEELTWVVYNANMVQNAVTLIVSLRGIDFFDDYVKVISRECGDGARGALYFDPHVFKLLGNGYD
jgi:hypothetical protein